MNATARSPVSVQKRGSYFYLSYAHSPPLTESQVTDPDQWVRRFFDDLSAAVARHAEKESGLAPGFYDQELLLGTDWKANLNHALSTAEVFVPLYSPSYFARSWPGREWACFRDRLIGAGVEDPVQRFAPVLWVPLRIDQDSPPAMSRAMAVGATEPAYAENGLQALLRLAPYRESYEKVVDNLAAAIVNTVQSNPPLPPSVAPDIYSVPSAFSPAESGAYFAVRILAPTAQELPAHQDRSAYGDSGRYWRPFPDEQQLPLADYATQVAEQLLDFAVKVTDADPFRDSYPRPGVILIDPWFAAAQDRLAVLRAMAAKLPVWVIPFLVLGAGSEERIPGLVNQVRDILEPLSRDKPEPTRDAISGVSSLQAFMSLMPRLVAEAQRQYLRHGPVRRAWPRSGGLPRIGGPPSANTSIMHRPGKETPNA
jgi:FxsC-like protein